MKAGTGRHSSPASRPARAGLIAALAGSLVTLAGGAGIIAGNWHDRGAYVAGPAGRVAVPHGQVAAAPDAEQDVQVPRPAFLVIPAIGVRTPLIRLGTTMQGTLQVPSTTSVAGWYTASPRPGAIGSSIIAGHVDSYLGPGIFFRLHLLRPGDRVYVGRANGTIAVFKVTEVEKYLKAEFPAEAVYGPEPYPGLRLITCGGVFDYDTGSYLSNIVVYADEISPSSAHATGTQAGSAVIHR